MKFFVAITFTLISFAATAKELAHKVEHRSAPAADCRACAQIDEEIGRFKAQARECKIKLADLRNQLGALDPDRDYHRKMILTSSIFVYSAKLETSENRQEINQSQWRANCQACPSSHVQK